MTKFKLVLAALALAACSAPAQAFHPFDETFGYVSPQQRRAMERERARANAALLAKQKAKNKKSNWFQSSFDDDDDDYQEQQPVFKKGSKKGPAKMSGGGKPHISAVSPPKVSFPNSYGAGTIVIDTAGRRLYYVLSSTTAYSYPVAVGKAGFAWTGTQKISRKVAWPDWRPPKEMLARKPHLPEHMTGGVRNPLGAMALYLGNSLYRIHGTNDAKSIGTAASSGCIRMTNGHVTHLSKLAQVGTTVRVLSKLPKHIAKAANSNEG